MRGPLVVLGVMLLLFELGWWLATGEKPFVERGDCTGSGYTKVCD